MGLIAFTTGSREGDARAPGALAKRLKSNRLALSVASAQQVHRTRIQIVPKLTRSKQYPKTDGLLTEAFDQPVAIFTADCVPVFINAAGGRVVGLLHAGWRGIQSGILVHAVRRLWSHWRIPAAAVQVWTGPSIGRCCFEVRWDVARYFPKFRRRLGEGRWKVDLAGALRAQARRRGARWVEQNAANGCTMHQSRYYSYRRDKTAKRQVSIMMKGAQRP